MVWRLTEKSLRLCLGSRGANAAGRPSGLPAGWLQQFLPFLGPMLVLSSPYGAHLRYQGWQTISAGLLNIWTLMMCSLQAIKEMPDLRSCSPGARSLPSPPPEGEYRCPCRAWYRLLKRFLHILHIHRAAPLSSGRGGFNYRLQFIPIPPPPCWTVVYNSACLAHMEI